MTDTAAIHGTCDARFVAVREALAANFRDHGEIGAAVAVVIDGRPVVDLWGGFADGARTRPWVEDTMVDVFSVGKAMATLALLILVDRGQVELDAPVQQYWPAFAAAGKGRVTVRALLRHRAGLPAIRGPLPPRAMYVWTRMTDALAAEVPWWEPDTQQGYHVNTFGFLVGEIVRRVAGEPIDAFFRRTVAKPLAADFHFGFGPEHDHRVADYVFGVVPPELIADGAVGEEPADLSETAVLMRRAYGNPPGVAGPGTVNTRAWRAAVMPSTNGHATARGVARIYAALAAGGTLDGVRLLGADTLAHAVAAVPSEPDAVLHRPVRFGLGFQLTQPERLLGPNPGAFGHFGAGGSLGFADPDARIAFGYVMNKAGPRWQNPSNRALVDAVYASL